MKREEIIESIADCLVRAGSTFPEDKKQAYELAIERECCETSRWLLALLLENGEAAESCRSPLCDDTGIPHILIDVGPSAVVTGDLLATIEEGVAEGLRRLPGRPMAVRGDCRDRLGQTLGMYDDPSMVEIAPVTVRRINEDLLRVHILEASVVCVTRG